VDDDETFSGKFALKFIPAAMILHFRSFTLSSLLCNQPTDVYTCSGCPTLALTHCVAMFAKSKKEAGPRLPDR
jgi:hypothetical protein